MKKLWQWVLDCLAALAEDDDPFIREHKEYEHRVAQKRYLDWLNARPP